MKLFIIGNALLCISLAIGAGVIAWHGKDGWGWFLFVLVLVYSTSFSSKSDNGDCDNDNTNTKKRTEQTNQTQ